VTARSSKKTETVPFVAPFGTARFPKLNKPDTEGQYADGKFKTIVMLKDEDVEKVRAAFAAAAKQLHRDIPMAQVKLPLKEIKNKDKDTGAKTVIGWGFEAKSKNRPLLLDAKKNKLPEGALVGGGSEIRVSGAIAPYAKTSTMMVKDANGVITEEEVEQKGLTIYLNAVQVRQLSVGGGTSDGSEFEVEEGFEYDGDATPATDDATNL
jgi:hypothetical protein